MGADFHITRADQWYFSEENPITAEEWLAYVDQDSELTLDPRNGEYHALWSGDSAYDEPWLDWCSGEIYTKWPDTFLFRKMFRIARDLNARVVDDEEHHYVD